MSTFHLLNIKAVVVVKCSKINYKLFTILLTFTLLTIATFYFPLRPTLVLENKSQTYIVQNSLHVKENRVLIRRPYVYDTECKHIVKTLYEAGTFNKTALVSYPGSGNTWLRHLIELSSGIYTGSIYFDLDLMSRGFLGEKEMWDSGSTVVQKVHSGYNRKFEFSRAILLLRDPYQSVVSFVQYLQAGHTRPGSPAIFRKKEWPTFILGQTYKWITLAKSWLESPVSLLVIHYENLKRNTTFEIMRICKFLQIDCPHTNSLCFKKYQEGSFHRKHKPGPPPPFSPFVLDKMDNGIDFLNSLLVRLGHQNLPLHYYKYYRCLNLTTYR